MYIGAYYAHDDFIAWPAQNNIIVLYYYYYTVGKNVDKKQY